MSRRAEYISKMEAQLVKLNQKMSSLESEAQEAKEEARQTYKEEMGKLRLKSKGAIAKLEELKASSEDSWETMVSDMEKMHDAFTHSFFSFFHTPQTDGVEEKSLKAGHSDVPRKA
jgi:ribosome recycling factor